MEVLGEVDAGTGYIASVTHLEAALRAGWAATIGAAAPDLLADPFRLLAGFARALDRAVIESFAPPFAGVRCIQIRFSPFHAIESTMPPSPFAILHRDFEFSASHRLAIEGKSDAENLALFGKCSNPNGHGHNYRLRVAVRTDGSAAARGVDLDGIVERAVLRNLDHKHLNLDTPYFRDRLPSVENIALTIHELLAEALRGSALPLEGVRVWENDRTSAATCTCA